MRSVFATLALVLVAFSASCVPADEALPLGSAQFTVSARGSARDLTELVVTDGWNIHVDRFILSFKTMTIVNLLDSDQCAYRGRGAADNVVFDGTEGTLVQAFNGIKPGDCPDVGMRLRPPDDRTVLGEGATVDDLKELTTGPPAHALFFATATRRARPGSGAEDETVRVKLRFDTERTSAGFGGCRDAIRGARIRPRARYNVYVAIAAESLFRDAVSTNAQLQFAPYADADRLGNDDGIVTMDELDTVQLASVRARYGPFYQLPNGSSLGSFGDYVRAQFQFSVKYGEGGICNGIEPGQEDEP